MERSKKPSWKMSGLRLSISLALVVFLVFMVDIQSMQKALQSISIGAVVFVILLCFVQMILAGFRWFLIGKMTGPFLSASSVFQINFGAMFSNQILPTSIGGDLIRIELSRQRGLSVGRATRTVVLDRTTGLVSLMVLLLATGFIMKELFPPTWPVFTLQLIAAAFVAGSFLIIYYEAVIEKRFSRLIYYNWLRQLFVEANLLGREGLTTGYAILISLIIHGIGALCLWYLALEIGIEVNYLTMLGILPIISLVQLVPVSIAGWGVREGTVVTLFTVLGVEPSLGLLVSLIWGGAIAMSALLSGAIWFFGK